jgi:eukaryotic translation initiation factor 2C
MYYEQVMVEEVAAIHKCCEEMSDGSEVYRPPLTFITCQKRHHTRLFVVNERDTDQSGNIPAGTVVSQFSLCNCHLSKCSACQLISI